MLITAGRRVQCPVHIITNDVGHSGQGRSLAAVTVQSGVIIAGVEEHHLFIYNCGAKPAMKLPAVICLSNT